MKNISFDNPQLLWVILPAIALLIIPFIIAIRKENKSKSATASLILHVLMIVLVSLALAGTVMTTVITETQVYVVADVSYSANKNLDVIDGYIASIKEELPINSKIGVVCFGKDYKLLSDLDGEIVSVENALGDGGVDDSATNISDALDYTATLFGDEVIKKIVLITDGKETDVEAAGNLIGSIENLYAQDIQIDAIYIDSNVGENTKEIQISDVDFTGSTYLNHSTTADVLVQSSYETQAIISLYKNDELFSEKALELIDGFNYVNFDLDTSVSGDFDYRIEIEADDDESDHNNEYFFTQNIAGKLSVLLVTSDPADELRAKEMYGDGAEITSYINRSDVPFTIEEICQYDEIILSNVDVRSLDNVTAFVDSVDTAVSMFGKNLITMGDLVLQNKSDDILKKLEDMLPVKYGNSEQDPKLYAIVIDSSRSMNQAWRLMVAKQTAKQLLNVISDEDYVTVIAFSGEVSVVQSPVKAINRDDIAKLIDSLEPTQGTMIGAALKAAADLLIPLPYSEKQVMLISDGLSYQAEPHTPVDVTKMLKSMNIITSVINPYYLGPEGVAMLESIAKVGGGSYYLIEDENSIEEIMFSQVADDLTESVIEKDSPVNIEKANDPVLEGVAELPNISGFVYAKAKASATTVLTTDFTKISGAVVNPPIYSYWDYGNGRVCTYTSRFTGDWVENWNEGDGDVFLGNVMTKNTPEERVAYPYTLNVTFDGTNSTVEIIPAVLNPYATTHVKITAPDGSEISEQLTFDSARYFYGFTTPDIGKYGIEVTYSYDETSFVSNSTFSISYSPEYDSFAIFDPASLHEAIRNRGTVKEGEIPDLSNDEADVATYTVSYTVPLLAAAVVLFVIDIIIRKIKWKDIKSLFGKKA